MYYPSFAQRNNLKPGDVVVVPKSAFNLVAHYLVYWGHFNGQDYYLENNDVAGVRWINETLFLRDNRIVKRFRRFTGTYAQRVAAINRGKSLLGSPYDLQKFNCENYANYVQFGISYSKQVDTIKDVLIISGLIGVAMLFNNSSSR